MSKRILTLVLAFVLMLSMLLLAACGGGDAGKDSGSKTDTQSGGGESTPGGNETDPGGNETDPGSSESQTNPSKYPDAIPEDVKFDGGEVHFIIDGGYSNWLLDPEDAEDLNTGDAVEVAVYTRQSEVEDRFGISIIGHATEGTSEVNTKWAGDVSSGSNAYDVMSGHMRFNGSLALNNNNLNINKLKYVDLSKDYWNASYCNAWSYKKVQFWVTGDIDVHFLEVMVAVYVNKDIFDKYHSDVDLTAIVENGEWTYVKALELIDGVYEDLNGDGVKNTGDMFGWATQNTWSVASLAYSGGFQLTVADGSKSKVNLTTAENIAIYNDFFKLINSEYTRALTEDDNPCVNGYSMFTHERLSRMTGASFAEINFTVIPTPKYAVEEPYRTASYDGVPLIGVESALEEENYDMIGAFLESYAAAGKKYVTEGFYEQGLRGKYSQDEGAYRCLAIIRAAGWIDFAYAWANHMDDLYTAPGSAAAGGAASIEAFAASIVPAAQKKLDALYTSLSKAAKAVG
ncbi:MAG: hypothetical protein IJR83_00140 [Clostridia bacterium]|nr:hypothetical protein [Clostridia bacterium]